MHRIPDMRVYLDNNRMTKVDSQVFTAMEPLLSERYGVLHALHESGGKSRRLYAEAMEKLYAGIHAAEEDDIFITSGGAENHSTLFLGIYLKRILTGRKNNIIVSERESPSILQAAELLVEQGCRVMKLPVGSDGFVDPSTLYDYITPATALVSVQMVDDESGAINDVEAVCEICKKYDVPFHTDATQAIGKIPVDVQQIGADYLTFSAETFHAPAGTGGFYVRRGDDIFPVIKGKRGHYDRFGAGPVNISGAVGMGKAMELAVDALEFEMEETKERRDRLEEALRDIPGVTILVPWALRVPNTLLVSFEGIESEMMLYELNRAGIEAYSHTVYPFGNWERPAVTELLGLDPSLRHTTVGFALSRNNTDDEIEYTIKTVKETVSHLYSFSCIKPGRRKQ